MKRASELLKVAQDQETARRKLLESGKLPLASEDQSEADLKREQKVEHPSRRRNR